MGVCVNSVLMFILEGKRTFSIETYKSGKAGFGMHARGLERRTDDDAVGHSILSMDVLSA